MLKIVNAFIKDHRQELGLKGYSKMSYLEKLKYLEGKVKGTKYEREIGKLTKPRVDEGIKKVLDKSGRGKNVRVKKEKKVKFTKLEEAKPSQTAVAKPKLKPKPKGKVKKAVAKIEEEIDKPKPSVKGKTYYLELDIKKISPSLLKFAEGKGWEVYEKTSEKVYIKKKMTTDESLDDDIWGSRKSPGALRSSRGVKLTDKKEKVIPSAGGKEDDKPKPKTTTKEALQEMPLDIGAKISEEQSKRWESRLDKLIKSAPKNYGNKKFMEIGLEGFKAVDRRFQKKGFETKDLKMYLSKLPSDEERLKVISAMEQEVERLVGVSTKGKGERLEQQKQEVKSAFDNKKDIGLRIGKKGYWGKVISMDDKGFVIEGEIGEPKSGARTNPYSKNREYYDYMDFNKKGKKRIPYTQLGSYGVMDKKPTF